MGYFDFKLWCTSSVCETLFNHAESPAVLPQFYINTQEKETVFYSLPTLPEEGRLASESSTDPENYMHNIKKHIYTLFEQIEMVCSIGEELNHRREHSLY